MGSQSFYTVSETATRAGQYLWLERRLFELMGAWVADIDDPEVKYVLGTQSYHHEFFAELWAKRLLQLGGDESLAVAPDTVLASELSLDRWADHSAGVKLVVLYRTILPRMAASYAKHRGLTSGHTDGATVRVLELCLRDYRIDWPDGEFLVQSFMEGSDAVSEAQSEQLRLESAFAHRFGLITTAM